MAHSSIPLLRSISRAVTTGHWPLPQSQARHCVIGLPQRVATTPPSHSTIPFQCSQARYLNQALSSHRLYPAAISQLDNRIPNRSYTTSHHLQHAPPSLPQRNNPTRNPTMADDDAYTSFLERANADPSAGVQSSNKNTSSFHATKAVDANQHVPQVLSDVEMYYISDADETFDPVVLSWPEAAENKWPTTGTSFLDTGQSMRK